MSEKKETQSICEIFISWMGPPTHTDLVDEIFLATLMLISQAPKTFISKGVAEGSNILTLINYDEYISTVKPVHSNRRQKIGFQDGSLLHAGQKYCRMLSFEECSKRAFCNIFDFHIKLPSVFKTFVLSIFEFPF